MFRLSSARDVQRAIWIVFAALVVCLVLFGSYYYWDRYVHLGDKSPLELDIAQMEEAVRAAPQDPEARVVLAEYYLRKGMYEEALEQARQVLQLYPEREGALLVSGIAQVRLNRPEAALNPLRQFIASRENQPLSGVDRTLEAAYYFLGESLVKLERQSEAISVLEAALDISPADADAHYQLGRAYQATEQLELALAQYHRAVRLVPDFTDAYSGMIECYVLLGQQDHATYARGMCAYGLKDYEGARKHLEQAAQALPDFAPTHLGLGLTYEKMGKLDVALVAVQRALELDPDDYATQHTHSRILAAVNAQD